MPQKRIDCRHRLISEDELLGAFKWSSLTVRCELAGCDAFEVPNKAPLTLRRKDLFEKLCRYCEHYSRVADDTAP
jgi:hypothetical protein